MSAPRWLAGLALLLAITGTGLRFQALDAKVVWHDEVFTAVRAFGHDHGDLLATLFSGRLLTPSDLLAFQAPAPGLGWDATVRAVTGHPEHGPLYYLLARLGAGFTDDPILAVRGASALLSLLLLPALFWLGLELFGPGRAAWIAMAQAAVSPLHLLYAQEARQYALWSALAAAASAAYLHALRRGRRIDWALYGALLALGLYTHLLFTVVVAVHGLHGLLLLARDRAGVWPAAKGWLAAVAGAGAAFAPWLVVIALRVEALRNFTGWMDRETTLPRLLGAWGNHLVRVFADLPSLEPWHWLLLLPLAAAALVFHRTAPVRARGFIALMVLLPAAAVVVPDFLIGGRRSLEARYLFPLFLGLELMLAWVLAAGLAGRGWRRAGAGLALALVIGLGLASDRLILGAESWWNKSYSGENAAFAARVNAAPRPLVVGSSGDVNPGEIISLAWRVRPETRFLLEPAGGGGLVIPPGYSDLFVLLPSETLRRQLEQRYRLELFPGSWKWHQAIPLAGEPPADCGAGPLPVRGRADARGPGHCSIAPGAGLPPAAAGPPGPENPSGRRALAAIDF